jgi:RNA polymerase sigma factor (sigma-70 family)
MEAPAMNAKQPIWREVQRRQGSTMTSPDRPGPGREDELVPVPGGESDAGLPAELRGGETRLLVERAKAGEVEALNELFTRYHGFVLDTARRRLGRRLREKEEADDLAQTTFREATRDFGQYEYRGESSLLAWLVQILQNKIRDKAEYYSATKRDVSRERASVNRTPDAEDLQRYDPPSGDLPITQSLAREEEFAILREALQKISATHRKAITLVFFQGLSLRAAGEQLGGRSEDAVRMLLRRAEARLHRLLRTRIAR